MEDEISESNASIWKKFLRSHWKATTVFAMEMAVAAIGALLVYLWYVGQAQANGLVPGSLGLWTMGDLVDFMLNLIFWEVVLVAVPLIVSMAVWYMWWRKLPSEEREDYKRGKLFGNRTKRSDAGNGFSFLIFLAFIIKIYLDGNWNKPFSTWSFDYLVNSGVTALVFVLAIIGIPMLIGGLWWMNRWVKEGA